MLPPPMNSIDKRTVITALVTERPLCIDCITSKACVDRDIIILDMPLPLRGSDASPCARRIELNEKW
jgi:hypothetical protein